MSLHNLSKSIVQGFSVDVRLEGWHVDGKGRMGRRVGSEQLPGRIPSSLNPIGPIRTELSVTANTLSVAASTRRMGRLGGQKSQLSRTKRAEIIAMSSCLAFFSSSFEHRTLECARRNSSTLSLEALPPWKPSLQRSA